MTVAEMYEKGSRLKFRYDSRVGLIGTEDLWDLSLVHLDEIAKACSKAVKEAQEESFIKEKSSKDEVAELKFETVKHIIKVRLEELKEAENEAVRKQKKVKLAELIEKKKDEALSEKSLEELQELLDSM